MEGAVRARYNLQGEEFNGGVIKINFASASALRPSDRPLLPELSDRPPQPRGDRLKRGRELSAPLRGPPPPRDSSPPRDSPPQRAPLPTYPDGTVDASRIKDMNGKPARGNLWVGGFKINPTEVEVSVRGEATKRYTLHGVV